jgi:hypothetical protein
MPDEQSYRTIEQLSGSGTVAGVDLTEQLQVRYEIVIREAIDGGKHIGGKIWCSDDPFMAHRLLQKNLTLNMADGRIWDFLFVHRSGESANRGGRTP